MSRRSIRHGAVVACDMPECSETFTTYSIVSIARKQALSAGWARERASLVEHGGHRLGKPKQKVDLCPTHKLKPRIEGATP